LEEPEESAGSSITFFRSTCTHIQVSCMPELSKLFTPGDLRVFPNFFL
jgi:hypothetical protein